MDIISVRNGFYMKNYEYIVLGSVFWGWLGVIRGLDEHRSVTKRQDFKSTQNAVSESTLEGMGVRGRHFSLVETIS